MNWRFSRNRSPPTYEYPFVYGNNNRNGRPRGRNNRRYRSPSPPYYSGDNVGYSTSIASRYEYDVRIIPQSRSPYSYHHNDVVDDRYIRGFRISGPYEEETQYMRGFRTYDLYPYDDPYRAGSSNYPSHVQRYDYYHGHQSNYTQYPHNYDHRMGDHRFAESHLGNQSRYEESHYGGDHRYANSHYNDPHFGNVGDPRFAHLQPEQPRYGSPRRATQPTTDQPRLIFPHVNKTRVTHPTKSSLRQPRDDNTPENKAKKKVTFKKRATARKISPEPEKKKWCNLFRKKNRAPIQRGPTPAEYLGASEEREWY